MILVVFDDIIKESCTCFLSWHFYTLPDDLNVYISSKTRFGYHNGHSMDTLCNYPKINFHISSLENIYTK